MSTRKNKQTTKTNEKLSPTSRSSTMGTQKKSGETMLFKRHNFVLILAGFALICFGYLLMSGGNMPDRNTWDPELIYSSRRTFIAPIFILAGLGLEVYAVFKK